MSALPASTCLKQSMPRLLQTKVPAPPKKIKMAIAAIAGPGDEPGEEPPGHLKLPSD